MSEERTRILELVAAGKITVDEATRLFDALAGGAKTEEAGEPAVDMEPGERQAVDAGSGTAEGAAPPKFLYVQVDGEKGEKVNVKVPLGLVRAGLKLTALIPAQAQDAINESMAEHGMGFDLSSFKSSDVEELLEALREMEITVDSPEKNEKVRIYAA